MSFAVDPTTPETLFRTLLLPVYPADVLEDLDAARATDANPAKNPLFFRELADTAKRFAKLAPEALSGELTLDGSDASIRRLSSAMTREARDRMVREKGPEGAPLLLYFVIHAAAYVGEAIVAHGGEWTVRRPLWESRVRLVSRAGDAELAPLMWIVRALSDEEVGKDLLASRFRMHVEVPTEKPDERAVFVDPARRLPRLKHPKYDTLHKYLRAHLPELGDLGGDFPSPERFTELGFTWLDFLVVGDGRMVVLAGPSETGFHLFWLDASGFAKAAYLPSDAFPEPIVKLSGETVRVVFQSLGRETFQEFLWWGP